VTDDLFSASRRGDLDRRLGVVENALRDALGRLPALAREVGEIRAEVAREDGSEPETAREG
jgi:hypothetical protein